MIETQANHFDIRTKGPFYGFALLALLFTANLAADELIEGPRRWSEGPLTKADFKGEPPNPLPVVGGVRRLAYTNSDLNFSMKFDYLRGNGEIVAELTELNIFAVLLDDSWMTPTAPKSLIDHEQGHFDISQAYALQMAVAWRQAKKEGKVMKGRGKDEAAAAADLQRQIVAFLKTGFDRTATAHADYDRLTRHGTLFRQQREQRQRQIKVLTELAEELKE